MANEYETIDRNVAAVHRLRKESDDRRRSNQVVIDHVAGFFGSPRSLYAHTLVYSLLIFLHIFSPTHTLIHVNISKEDLGIVASLEAIFLALFVLINQRRTSALERRNSDLALQAILLSEHEIKRLAQMMDLTAKRLGVETTQIEDIGVINKSFHPDEILERIAKHEAALPTESTDDLDEKT